MLHVPLKLSNFNEVLPTAHVSLTHFWSAASQGGVFTATPETAGICYKRRASTKAQGSSVRGDTPPTSFSFGISSSSASSQNRI